MFGKLKRTWDQLKDAPPGHRFQEHHHRCQAGRKGRWDLKRVSNVAGGVTLILIGLVLVPAPGPGWVIVGIGGAVLGGESRAVACFLDRVEVKARGAAGRAVEAWARVPAGSKALLGLLALTAAAGLGYGTYALLSEQSRLWKDRFPFLDRIARSAPAPSMKPSPLPVAGKRPVSVRFNQTWDRAG